MNLEQMRILLFYHFIYLKVLNLDLGNRNQLGGSSLNFTFAVVNLYQIVMEKRSTNNESWNLGPILMRRVSSRC